MNVQIVGLAKQELARYIRKHYPALHLVRTKPDVIICYGGDGTLLYGEEKFPGVPKAMIRNSQICARCSTMSKQTVLRLLQEKKFKVVKQFKLEARSKKFRALGMNDIVIGHPKINGTLRAKIYINGRLYRREFLGDGVVVATTLGSTGYYQSITSSNFFAGIGIAFNNAITLIHHLVVPGDTDIQVEITRGPAILVADNNKHEQDVQAGNRVHIRKARAFARLVIFPPAYENINLLNHLNRMPLGYCQVCRRVYEEHEEA